MAGRIDKVVLTGYMGSGKSTVGPKLAKRLDFDFVDTDSAIENSLSTTIAGIFGKRGEEFFRKREEQLTHKLIARSSVVIATGGGLPVHADSFAELAEGSLVVFLSPPLQWMWRHVQGREERPKAQNREQFEKLYRERLAVYQQADLELDPSELGVVRAVDIIADVFHEERSRTDD